MLTANEIKSFIEAKKLVTEDYAKHFGGCTHVLWSNVSEHEYSSIGDASFQCWLANKKTKDISAETANAIANEPRQPPGTIGQIQSEIASTAARSY